jgi:RNA polymerase sigma-32 factor
VRCGRFARVHSIDAPLRAFEADDERTLLDVLPADMLAPDATAGNDDVRDAVDALAPRMCRVLRSRYWREATLHEAGGALGVGRERARQIEAKALDRLRDVLAD